MGTKELKGVKNNDLFVRGAETYFVEKKFEKYAVETKFKE